MSPIFGAQPESCGRLIPIQEIDSLKVTPVKHYPSNSSTQRIAVTSLNGITNARTIDSHFDLESVQTHP